MWEMETMLTKHLQLLKGAVIVFEVLQMFWEHVLCGENDGVKRLMKMALQTNKEEFIYVILSD